MTVHRIIDLLLYTLVNFAAYIPLVVWPLRKYFKFSRNVSFILMGGISIAFFVLIFLVGMGLPAFWIPIVSFVGSISLMLFGLNVNVGKALSVFLIEYNIATFVTITAKNLEVFFFPNRAHALYCWTHSIFIGIGVVIVYLLVVPYTKRVLDDLFADDGESDTWGYIWLLPFSYYVIWGLYVAISPAYLNGYLESPMILLMIIVFMACNLITYYILIQLTIYDKDKHRLEFQNKINEEQYKYMLKRINETRKSRHDLRHHFVVLSSMADAGDIEGINEYLKPFTKKYESNDSLIYCAHFATNALLTFYGNQAHEEKIDYTVNCNLPEVMPIPEKDLTIVFSNLMENALNSCRKCMNDPGVFIKFHCHYDGTQLLVQVANTAQNPPKIDKNGRLLSTSHSGYGIGVESVKTMAEQYNGFLKYQYENGVFRTSVMMMVENEEIPFV